MYFCPNCDDTIVFLPETQEFSCTYCQIFWARECEHVLPTSPVGDAARDATFTAMTQGGEW